MNARYESRDNNIVRVHARPRMRAKARASLNRGSNARLEQLAYVRHCYNVYLVFYIDPNYCKSFTRPAPLGRGTFLFIIIYARRLKYL